MAAITSPTPTPQSPTLRRHLALALAAGLFGALPLIAAPVAAQTSRSVNLDVPFVPTPDDVVERMLDMAQVGNQDYVIDLGSGDGRIAIAAVKDRGAKGAMGVDIDPARIAEATNNAKMAGVSDAVEFRQQNLFETDLNQASVITMYLLQRINLKLRPTLLDLRPGTRIVSHAFSMDDWQPDAEANVDGRNVYFWIVPAKVDGSWKVQNPGGDFTVDLTQEFQKIAGTATVDGKSVPLGDPKLQGDRIEFSVETAPGKMLRYVGRVTGGSIEPLPDSQRAGNWRATRS